MSKEKYTLLFLIPGFPANEEDSTCLPSQQLLIRAWNELYPSLNIVILSFQYPFTKTEYNWFGNRVIPFGGKNKRKIFRILLWLIVWKRLKKIKDENNIVGVFSCWCSECALVGKYFSKKYNYKHFTWICGQDALQENKLVRFIQPDANSLIAISDFLVREFYRNHGIKPVHVIPIGLDTSLFSNQPAERNIDILGVGSLSKLKAYDIFIDVVAHLKQEFPLIKTKICGSGNQHGQLLQQVHQSNVDENVELTGSLPHAQIIGLMQRSKILLHTSSYEGFGAVCMEALYAGAHVISFCNPLQKSIPHWHIVYSKEEMISKAREILLNKAVDYSPVLVNDIKTSATAIMKLYQYNAD